MLDFEMFMNRKYNDIYVNYHDLNLMILRYFYCYCVAYRVITAICLIFYFIYIFI